MIDSRRDNPEDLSETQGAATTTTTTNNNNNDNTNDNKQL